jgi:hypothetical protein
MSSGAAKDLRSIILETDQVERALQKSAAETITRHKRLGQPIVVWRDGRVVWIPAEEIELPTTVLEAERTLKVPAPGELAD